LIREFSLPLVAKRDFPEKQLMGVLSGTFGFGGITTPIEPLLINSIGPPGALC
jgi:hypothetical protein